jgi:hypothetical protein
MDTNHQVHTPKPSSGSGLLTKLKPASAKETIKTLTPPAAGTVPGSTAANVPSFPGEGPRVVSETQPLAPVKDTRFSDTVHTTPPPLPMDDIVFPAGDVVAPGPTAESKGSNKLKKKQEIVTTPGMPPSGSVLGNGPAVPGASGEAVPVPGAKRADIAILEEVVLPDGTIAYVRSGTAPSLAPMPAGGSAGMPNIPAAGANNGSKKDKSKENVGITADTALPGVLPHIPAESEVGKGHCMMCCPTAPHDASGRPIFPCAHQDGIAGPSPMDRAQAASASAPGAPGAPGSGSGGGKKKSDKVVSPPPGLPDIPLPLGEEVAINHENVGGLPPAEALPLVSGSGSGSGGGKLKKGKGPVGGGSAGGAFSPEEEAMEDARKLAGEPGVCVIREAGLTE